MSFPKEIESLLTDSDFILKEISRTKIGRRFLLKLPVMSKERQIKEAWLEVPYDFLNGGIASIWFSKEYALILPHVNSNGKLCTNEDYGSLNNRSALERLKALLNEFRVNFISPWINGELDSHFEKEALNYWYIYCQSFNPDRFPVKRIYTIDKRRGESCIYFSVLLEKLKLIIVGNESRYKERLVKVLSKNNQTSNVLTAEISIADPFVPSNWPKNLTDITRILKYRMSPVDYNSFINYTEKDKKYRLVIFRTSAYSFGYIMPGGPDVKIKNKYFSTSCYNGNLLPLITERLDVSWTVGRDQETMVTSREKKKILLIGVGALGSHVAEQLAKAGIGEIILVDSDILSSANIGRHVLGVNSIGLSKAKALSGKISSCWPSCSVVAYDDTIQKWLKGNNLRDIDVVLDFTGEPMVRQCIDKARQIYSCPLLISWMEPYVVAAHACLLPSNTPWLVNNEDRLESLQVVSWPADVIQQEPACSSEFQSYTSSAAIHAVALATEAALDLIDGKIRKPIVRHWIRNNSYLDDMFPGLKFKKPDIQFIPNGTLTEVDL